MPQIRYILFIFIVSLMVFSCKEDKENHLRMEQEKLQKELNSNDIFLYKGVKIMVRSVSLKNNDEGLANEVLSFFSHKSGMKDISVSEVYKTFKKYKSLKDSVMFLKEDDYPTVLGNISGVLPDSTGELKSYIDRYWNSSSEHAFFSVMLNSVEDINPDYILYEVSLIEPEKLPYGEFSALVAIYQAIVFSGAGFVYTADDILTKNIENISTGKYKFESLTNKEEPYSAKEICLALSHFFRGILGSETGAEKDAIRADFEKFIELSEKTGIHKDLSLIAGLYLGQLDNDKEAVNKYLEQLSESDLFDEDGKKAIVKLSRKVRKGDIEVTEIFNHKHVNAQKILRDYLTETITASPYMQDIKKSEYGELIFSLPETVMEMTGWIENTKKVKKYIDKGKKILNLFD